MQVTMFIDGGSRGNPGLASIGVYVPNPPKGKVIEIEGFIGKATNNVAEYKALIQALHLAKQQGWNDILIKCDSLLVVNQLNGKYQIKNLQLMELYEQVCYYTKHIEKIIMVHISRVDNKEADRLCNQALDKAEKDGCREEVAFI